jgi:multidrug efflux pump subunit AcrA (membrane-fusion protein)
MAIVLVGGFVAYRSLTSEPTPAPSAGPVVTKTVAAALGPLDQTMIVSGQTAAIHFANIAAPRQRGPESNRELILMELAASGSWVKKGQIVAKIDAQTLQDHVDDLGDTIEAARSDIAKRQAEQSIEWENLQQTLRVTKSEADKASLDYKGSEMRSDVEKQLLKLTLDEAEARYKQAQSDLGEKKASFAAEIKILGYTLERHTRHRDRHARDIQVFTIRAPIDGLVVMQQTFRGGEMASIQQGDRVGPGQPFMKIVNTKEMQVEAQLNQAASSDLRIGQRATIKLDAFPGLEFNGKVHSIGALAVGGWRQNYYIRNVPVRIAIEGNDPKLIPDLSASAKVILSSAPSSTVVPLSALQTEGGKPVVYVKSGEAFEAREVDLGLKNETHVVIASGVKPGEIVRVN